MAVENQQDWRSSYVASQVGRERNTFESHGMSIADQVFGYALSVVILIVTAPLMALAFLATKMSSRGPIIYSQLRLGRDGDPFRIYKIRSMYYNCEGTSGPQWSTPGDPRVTPVGKILRVTHLDELPQLWNVLRGDMTLVGPRPERPEIAVKLEAVLPRYSERTRVLPGLTGLAQVQLPPDTDLESVRRKLICDFAYMERQSPWLDLRILVATATGILGIPFPLIGRVLGIPSLEQIEQGLAASTDQRRSASSLSSSREQSENTLVASSIQVSPSSERTGTLGIVRNDEVSSSVIVPTPQSQLA